MDEMKIKIIIFLKEKKKKNLSNPFCQPFSFVSLSLRGFSTAGVGPKVRELPGKNLKFVKALRINTYVCLQWCMHVTSHYVSHHCDFVSTEVVI